MEIKVCGMRDLGNVNQLISQLNPDWMGLIFYPKSPRFVSVSDAENLKQIHTRKVGVFVKERVEKVLELIDRFDLSAIQLHGGESLEYVSELRERTSKEIWKVISVAEDIDWNQIGSFEGKVDKFLFDTSGKNHGGTGEQFNWELIHGYPLKTPFFLSGGLDANSAKKIKELSQAVPQLIGVDLNSRFEISPGFKNIELLVRFKQELNGQLSIK